MSWAIIWAHYRSFGGQKKQKKQNKIIGVSRKKIEMRMKWHWYIDALAEISWKCSYIGEKWLISWKYRGSDISPTCIVSKVTDTRYIDEISLIYLDIFILDYTNSFHVTWKIIVLDFRNAWNYIWETLVRACLIVLFKSVSSPENTFDNIWKTLLKI